LSYNIWVPEAKEPDTMCDDLVQICANEFERHVDELVAAHRRGCVVVKSPIFSGPVQISEIPKLKQLIHNGLRARAWHERYGPIYGRRLPLTELERIAMFCSENNALHLVALYAISLQGRDFDYLTHPLYFDYARGVLASEHAKDYLREDPDLLREFPPKELGGLDERCRWRPLPNRLSQLIEGYELAT
jgi:hypothetical protein